jgi:hypothetical protein
MHSWHSWNTFTDRLSYADDVRCECSTRWSGEIKICSTSVLKSSRLKTDEVPQPVSWWRFEDSATLGTDSATTAHATPLLPCKSGAPPWRHKAFGSGGIVGGYIEVTNASLQAAGGLFPRSSNAAGATVSMLLRSGPDFHRFGNVSLFAAAGAGGWIEGAIERHTLAFRADTSRQTDAERNVTCTNHFGRGLPNIPAAVPCSRLLVPMDQAGRRTLFHLLDGAWHHVVFRKAAVTGEQSIWIDGQSPDGFQSAHPYKARGASIPQPQRPFLLLPGHFDGAIDEVALWDSALSDAVIHQHSADAMVHHRPYSMDAPTAPAPPPEAVAGLLDPEEFALGTICAGWVWNCTPSNCTAPNHVQLGATRGNRSQPTPLVQLQTYPSPRVAGLAAAASYGRNVPWFTVTWLAGDGQVQACDGCKNKTCVNAVGDPCWNYTGRLPAPGPTSYDPNSYDSGADDSQTLNHFAQQSRLLGLELAQHWHYPLFMGGWNQSIHDANHHPELPLAARISRGGTSTIGAQGANQIDPSVINRSHCFLQSKDGILLGLTGIPRPSEGSARGRSCNTSANNGGLCVLRPCVTCAFDCGDALARLDGKKFLGDPSAPTVDGRGFHGWTTGNPLNPLRRKVDMLYDDGEYLWWFHMLHHALDLDPVMVADYESLGIVNMSDGERDWLTYTSMWRAKNTETFRKTMVDTPSSPVFNATYGEYLVGGDTMFRPAVNGSWMLMSNGKCE